MIGFLFDENATPEFRDQLLARAPDMRVFVIGDGIAPPKSTPDRDILLWIEANDCILATYNYSSMPVHLSGHLAQGHHVPGIVQLNPDMSMGGILEDLLLMWGAGLPDEFMDRISYLPLR